jgi:hypothetical protein
MAHFKGDQGSEVSAPYKLVFTASRFVIRVRVSWNLWMTTDEAGVKFISTTNLI